MYIYIYTYKKDIYRLSLKLVVVPRTPVRIGTQEQVTYLTTLCGYLLTTWGLLHMLHTRDSKVSSSQLLSLKNFKIPWIEHVWLWIWNLLESLGILGSCQNHSLASKDHRIPSSTCNIVHVEIQFFAHPICNEPFHCQSSVNSKFVLLIFNSVSTFCTVLVSPLRSVAHICVEAVLDLEATPLQFLKDLYPEAWRRFKSLNDWMTVNLNLETKAMHFDYSQTNLDFADLRFSIFQSVEIKPNLKSTCQEWDVWLPKTELPWHFTEETVPIWGNGIWYTMVHHIL